MLVYLLPFGERWTTVFFALRLMTQYSGTFPFA
jgi:hypothetical protein